ncbi:MAG: EF-P lysine aminoacylase EpmA [Methylococcales bacterium]|nr:EF-P lysine aminoacylase EpmA [Methylococcales bacterium]
MQSAWQPSCSIETLHLRARLLAKIRAFFLEKAVLEVETPLLSHTIGTDPSLAFFATSYDLPPFQHRLFLQTSPEFAMKRLLAVGCGSIYQIAKAFRNGESGRFHNPEFTLLEWYRIGFTLSDLMDEVAELIVSLFADYQPLVSVERCSYQAIFQQYTGLDALVFCYADYCAYALANELPEAVALCEHDHALWLDVLFSHKVQPYLGDNALCMIYGYPACQSSLARLNADNPLVTDRVELFINGIELGNGFYELTDAIEQNQRFDAEIAIRQQRNLPEVLKDDRLIAALNAGLPECSGIAIGLDRLLMLLSKTASIDEVLSFSIHSA